MHVIRWSKPASSEQAGQSSVFGREERSHSTSNNYLAVGVFLRILRFIASPHTHTTLPPSLGQAKILPPDFNPFPPVWRHMMSMPKRFPLSKNMSWDALLELWLFVHAHERPSSRERKRKRKKRRMFLASLTHLHGSFGKRLQPLHTFIGRERVNNNNKIRSLIWLQ